MSLYYEEIPEQPVITPETRLALAKIIRTEDNIKIETEAALLNKSQMTTKTGKLLATLSK